LAGIAELQEQLLAWEQEVDSQEGAIIAWEEGLMVVAHVLGEASVEHDASHAGVHAIQWDFSTQASASSS
jgi:hypothetical protein